MRIGKDLSRGSLAGFGWLFVLGQLTGAGSAFAQQPDNDNFADRVVLTGAHVSVSASNVGATREDGEPNDSGLGRVRYEKSLWWSWIVPTNGLVVIQTSRSDFDTAIEVYTGAALSGLMLTTNSNFASLPAMQMVTFPVAAGVAYQIAVGGIPFRARGDSGNIALELWFFETPANDDFALRTTLGSGDVRVVGSNAGATAEPDERFPWWPLAGGSVWWSWTATNSGPVTVTVVGPAYDPDDPLFFNRGPLGARLALYTGESLKTLYLAEVIAEQAFGPFPSTAQITWNALAGMTYQIQVDGSFGLQDSFSLNIAQTTPPTVVVVSPRLNGEYSAGSSVPIHAEAFDPDGEVQRVEFQLTSFVHWPSTGASFVHTRSPFTTVLSNAAPGHYSVTAWATDNHGAEAKSFSIPFDVRPLNDNFADRIPFAGASVTVTGTLVNASFEPSGNPGGDVWWTWTAPVSGTFTISAALREGIAPAMRVFTGSSLTNLSLVTESRFPLSDFSNSNRIVMRATAGTPYQIALISFGGSGDLECTLSVTSSAPPSIVIRQPTNNAFFEWNEPVTVTAEGSDPDGVVKRVDFFGDSVLLGSVTNPPFALAVTLTNGDHQPTLRAQATDDAGLTTLSPPVRVLVGYEPVSHPPNDNFADRILLTGLAVSATGSLDNATSEPGEPAEAPSSVWWTWTAPTNGIYTIVAATTHFSPRLVVFRGSDLTNLTFVAGGWGDGAPDFSARAAFPAEAGITYAIALSSSWAARREFTLNVIPTAPPFVTITSPTNDAKFFVGDIVTLSADAQDRDGSISKVEFFRNTVLVATVTNRPFSTTLTFASGFAASELLARATDDSGASSLAQEVFIRINFPRNDDFANRLPISGIEVSAAGDGTWATLEAGEPNPGGRASSIWWAWTAPESGLYTVTASADCCRWPALAIFAGSSLADLVLVTNSADRVENLSYSAQVVINATGGREYQIAVDNPGRVSLDIAKTTPPVVLISSPTNGTTIFEGESLQLSAEVADEGTVERVDFYIDNTLVGTVTSAPFTFTVPAVGLGLRSVRARATDNFGVSSYSPDVPIHAILKPPPNDNFENRILLLGAVISQTGTLSEATIEPGEPDILASPFPFYQKSVWWSWIPPMSGIAVLTCFLDGDCEQVVVYTGNELTNLTALVRGPGDFIPSTRQIVFEAVAGTSYQISFQSSCGYGHEFVFSVFLDARQLGPIELSPDGQARGIFQTSFDEPWIVEGSDDLVNWAPISTNTPLDGTFEFQDREAPDHNRRFYRVKSAR